MFASLLRRVGGHGSFRTARIWLRSARGSLWPAGVTVLPGQLGLDIGCGPYKLPGFIGVDLHVVEGVDVIANFDGKSFPFASNALDFVYASHVLEHVRDLNTILAEVSRVLKPGGVFLVRVPYAGSLSAFQDPTHVRFFTVKTFEYFVKQGSRVPNWYQNRYFQSIERRALSFSARPISLLIALLVNRSPSLLDLYESSFLRVVPAEELCIELRK